MSIFNKMAYFSEIALVDFLLDSALSQLI